MPVSPSQLKSIYHTIPAGAAYNLASPIDIRLVEPVSLIMPAAWTDAAISFSGSHDGSLISYGWLANSAAKIIKISPAKAYHQYVLSRSWFYGSAWLFLVSGDLTLGLSGLINQAADRTLILNCRDREGVVLPTEEAVRI